MTFMDYTRATLQAAHRHSSNHRKELERSEICGPLLLLPHIYRRCR